MKKLKFLLYPLSVLYTIYSSFRNLLFDLGLINSIEYKIPSRVSNIEHLQKRPVKMLLSKGWIDKFFQRNEALIYEANHKLGKLFDNF